MYFSHNLSYLASERGLKNIFLAKELNLSPQQIGRYLNGESQPKMETLVQLGKLFDVAIDGLILVDLSKESGRPFGQGSTESAKDEDAQTLELNRLLRLRVAELERNIKRLDADRARELGIE